MKVRIRRKERSPLEALSPRQREIMALIQRGLNNQEIADQLELGIGTVKQHIAALFRRLNVRSRTQALAAISGYRIEIDDSGEPGAEDAEDPTPPWLRLEQRPVTILTCLILPHPEAPAQGATAVSQTTATLSALAEATCRAFGGTQLGATTLGLDLAFGITETRDLAPERALAGARFLARRLQGERGGQRLSVRIGLATGLAMIDPTQDRAADRLYGAWAIAKDSRTLATVFPADGITVCGRTQTALSGQCSWEQSIVTTVQGRLIAYRPADTPEGPGARPEWAAKLLLPGEAKGLAEIWGRLTVEGKGSVVAVTGQAGCGRLYLMDALQTLAIESDGQWLGVRPNLGQGRERLIPYPHRRARSEGDPADDATIEGLDPASPAVIWIRHADQDVSAVREFTERATADRPPWLIILDLPPGKAADFQVDRTLAVPISEDRNIAEAVNRLDRDQRLGPRTRAELLRLAAGRPRYALELAKRTLDVMPDRPEPEGLIRLPMPLDLFSEILGSVSLSGAERAVARLAAAIAPHTARTTLAAHWPLDDAGLWDATGSLLEKGIFTADRGRDAEPRFADPLQERALALTFLPADLRRLRTRVSKAG